MVHVPHLDSRDTRPERRRRTRRGCVDLALRVELAVAFHVFPRMGDKTLHVPEQATPYMPPNRLLWTSCKRAGTDPCSGRVPRGERWRVVKDGLGMGASNHSPVFKFHLLHCFRPCGSERSPGTTCNTDSGVNAGRKG